MPYLLITSCPFSVLFSFQSAEPLYPYMMSSSFHRNPSPPAWTEQQCKRDIQKLHFGALKQEIIKGIILPGF
ncbi:uncharacterized protein EV420DRAFT_1511675 [Desarmillaria tabescens]|uniref:Uncharacterized protein n=1 Tax=Armillaria tabescens TaxID=1929756 RepID=A0AA39NIX0_ARMTA|nr:uncharacterized protein EV420DRAFT_1511675 [Desarmillaria tabescens]KAK0466450.1 hypothetical protein EV420DRAFT_1511675 [Desarmillaria tabescens]